MCSHISFRDCLVPEGLCLLGKRMCTEANSLAQVCTAAGLGVSSLKAMSVTAMSSALLVTYGCSYPQRSHWPKLCDLKDWPDLGLLSGTVPLGLPTALSSGAKCSPPPTPGAEGLFGGGRADGCSAAEHQRMGPWGTWGFFWNWEE